MIYENVLQEIGNTPLVRINRMNPNPDVSIYAKIEGNNPTGSINPNQLHHIIGSISLGVPVSPISSVDIESNLCQ